MTLHAISERARIREMNPEELKDYAHELVSKAMLTGGNQEELELFYLIKAKYEQMTGKSINALSN